MKSKSFVFVLSFVPGVGHLYLGQMKRGTQLLLLFFGIIFLLNLNSLAEIAIFLPVIWFFSVFDALQQHALVSEGVQEDRSIIQWDKLNHKWVAYFLIGMGAFIIINNSFNIVAQYIQFFRRFDVSTFLLALVFIVIGVKILYRPKQTEMKNTEEKIHEKP